MRDLPVDNVSRVEVGESRYDLCRVEPDVVERKPAGRPEVVEELPPGHVGEEEVEVAPVHARPQQGDQEGMLDLLERLLEFQKIIPILIRSEIHFTCRIFFSFLTCSTCFIFKISSIDITLRAKYFCLLSSLQSFTEAKVPECCGQNLPDTRNRHLFQ